MIDNRGMLHSWGIPSEHLTTPTVMSAMVPAVVLIHQDAHE